MHSRCKAANLHHDDNHDNVEYDDNYHDDDDCYDDDDYDNADGEDAPPVEGRCKHKASIPPPRH